MISTHVLDTARGHPAEGVPVVLEGPALVGWKVIGQGVTDGDGRVDLVPEGASLQYGRYRLTFDTREYFRRRDEPAFYPEVTVVFEFRDGNHHHVPLLLSPFGYTTYRGS